MRTDGKLQGWFQPPWRSRKSQCSTEQRVLWNCESCRSEGCSSHDGVLKLTCFNNSDLNFQWYEGSEAIPGACGDKLVLVNAGDEEAWRGQEGEVGGRITCCVSNRHGSSWAACPILLPASPQHAKEVLDSIDNPKRYRLECRWNRKLDHCSTAETTCRCGIVTEGSAAMLCQNSCACGAVCCGKIKCLDLPEGCLI
eukprot:593645-Hanusia_phi.AAC.2